MKNMLKNFENKALYSDPWLDNLLESDPDVKYGLIVKKCYKWQCKNVDFIMDKMCRKLSKSNQPFVKGICPSCGCPNIIKVPLKWLPEVFDINPKELEI